ncbi:MAG: DUF4493 domain-containing protein [Rikenellaceae bacterium]|nr:DUF4493 domain-containing protein [Rikenellaceae bacterium]
MKRYILWAVGLMMILNVSCEQGGEMGGDPNAEVSYGTLNLSAVAVTVEESTRAMSTDNFLVTLLKASGEEVESWTLGEMPDQVQLREGDYRVEVASATNHAPVSREGYFSGGCELTIVSGKTTTPDPIVCPLESLKVSVEFRGEIVEAMSSDCGTTVSLEDASLRVAATDNAPIYFRPEGERNTLKVVFAGTVDGASERFETEIAGVRVGQWRHIVIKMTYEDGKRVFSASSIDPWNKDEDIYVE